jgi:hypothetical protein
VEKFDMSFLPLGKDGCFRCCEKDYYCMSCTKKILASVNAAEHHMHTDAASAAVKAGESAPEFNPVKAAGSQAAPVM